MRKIIGKIRYFITIFQQAFGKYRFQIIILTLLGFLSGVFEGIGINALIPLLSFFTDGSGGGDDFISRFIENAFASVNISFSLLNLLIFIIILFFLKAFVLLLFTYIRAKIKSEYERETRDTLLQNTLASTWSHLLKQKLGHLETLLMVDVRLSAKLFEVAADSLMLVMNLIVYLVIAVNISPSITFITLGFGILIFFLFKPLLYRTRVVARQTASLNKEVTHHVSESILGIKTIKTMSKEDIFRQKGAGHFYKLKAFQIRIALLSSLATVFIQPFSIVLISLLFVFSFYFDSGFNFAVLAALVYLIHRIFSYVQTIQGNMQSINNFLPYLTDVLSYKNESLENREDISASKPFQFSKKLSFRHVTFSYVKGESALSDVTFDIKKGEMVGFIGESGAGKTTIFDLILRLFHPTDGSIMLDEKDIALFNMSSWRENIGYVSQDIFLVNDTIANNIRFFDNSISDKQVIEASKIAHIHDFIETLPDTFDTMVGERGVRLSGGQRQRIAIARALVKKPEILLLDEATSSLDDESEVEIQKALLKLKGNMTIIAIAHRLSTITNSDKLFVLKDGSIIEEGIPERLLDKKDSYFYKVYNIRK